MPFALYAFNNHDLTHFDEHCYAMVGDDNPVDPTLFTEGEEAYDVTEQFLFFFKIGFIIMTATIPFFIMA
jgi:hypothetical protein